jgi:SsrA-binding protein
MRRVVRISENTGTIGVMSLIENKRAGFDYEILETLEAGLELFGFEVKSLRAGHGSLKGARVIVRGGEAYLVGASIPPWQVKNAPQSYDPERPRRLLLNTKEIMRVSAAEGAQGLTVIPLSVYNKARNLKIEIAIARGKKKEDKRQTIRAREEKRSIRRTLKIK